MAIIQGLLGILSQSAGKIFNTAFGWATVMLFGKVPQSRQIYLSVIALGSVAWMVALLGTVSEDFASILLAFRPLPGWIDRGWVWLAMLIAALIIPLVVGVASVLMLDPEERPKGLSKAIAVLKGYPYTLGMSITLIMMIAFAPVMKVRTMAKRWTSEHVPVVIESKDYLTVVGDVQKALERGGLKTEAQQASWMLRLPTKVLTLLAGGAIENLVADELTTLTSPEVEVLMHPSDLVISGRELDAARAHAIITEQLTFTKAYMTWDKEANQLEDRLRNLWRQARSRSNGRPDPQAIDKLRAVEGDLRSLRIPYEEWEVLFREKLVVERGLLQVAAGISDKPLEPTDVPPEQTGAGRVPREDGSNSRLIYASLGTAAVAAAIVAWRGLSAEKPTLWEQVRPGGR